MNSQFTQGLDLVDLFNKVMLSSGGLQIPQQQAAPTVAQKPQATPKQQAAPQVPMQSAPLTMNPGDFLNQGQGLPVGAQPEIPTQSPNVETSWFQEAQTLPGISHGIDLGRALMQGLSTLATPQGSAMLGQLAQAIAPGSVAANVGALGTNIAQQQMYSEAINNIFGGGNPNVISSSLASGLPIEMQQQLFQNIFGLEQFGEKKRAATTKEGLEGQRLGIMAAGTETPEQRLMRDLMTMRPQQQKPMTLTREEEQGGKRFKVNYDYDYDKGEWTEASRSSIPEETPSQARAGKKDRQKDLDKVMARYFSPLIQEKIRGGELDEESSGLAMQILGGDIFSADIDSDRLYALLGDDARKAWNKISPGLSKKVSTMTVDEIISEIGTYKLPLEGDKKVDLFK